MSNGAFSGSMLGPVILRLALAAVFLYHGWIKIATPQNDYGTFWAQAAYRQATTPSETALAAIDKEVEKLKAKASTLKDDDIEKIDAEIQADLLRESREKISFHFSQLGRIPDALHHSLVQFLVAWGELLGGAALLLGLLTRWAAAGLIIIQAGAIYMVTWPRGFASITMAGYEYNVVLIAMCLALIFTGAGPFAVDRLRGRRRTRAEQRAPVSV
jgi:uncharacterized membrane protein YphA (DoxX/SURF4 family)